MRAAGVELLAGLDELGVMGIVEILEYVPTFLRVRGRIRKFLREEGVDLFVPIDNPGLNLSLARTARARGARVLYYIAPQVWAWREGRARRLVRHSDRICVVFPFEVALLERYGGDVRFVGHPLVDEEEERRRAMDGGRAAGAEEPPAAGGIRDTGGDGRSPPLLGLFPGSRAQEVERILPAFARAAELLRRQRPELRVAVARAPELPDSLYDQRGGADLEDPDHLVHTARAALTKSGTITLQLALAGVPMVVGYRTSTLSFAIARRLVKVPHIGLVNLVAGEEVAPELLQDELTPQALAEAVAPLLVEGPARHRALAGLDETRRRLGGPGCSARVAQECLDLLEGR